MAVPLSYSLPAFRPDGWDRAAESLVSLWELGFRWVTLHPTFAVTDDLHIRTDNVPDPAPVVDFARGLGMHVRMEPHLDYERSLNGGEYEWRNSMRMAPTGIYYERVLRPLAALDIDELTVGSELDSATATFASTWRMVAAELKRPGLSIGHKFNHDWGHSLTRRIQLRAYLHSLDYKAVSMYTPEPWELDPAWTVGEFGLGSTDQSRPWHFGEDLRFRTELDFAARRAWYLRFLEWLGGREGRAASFWTVGQFDVLGLMWPEWRDGVIADAVRRYNQASP